MSSISVPSRHGFQFFKIQDPENSLQVKPYLAELESSREEDMKLVIKSVNTVKANLENLKTEVCTLPETQNADNTDNLRKKMFNAEEELSRLKEAMHQELIKLIGEEARLWKEIQFMEKRIEEWSRPVQTQITKPIQLRNCKDKGKEDPALEFQKFLINSGGRYGGWEEHDHLLFLKERKKYKQKERFFSALHCLLPDLNYETIAEHEEWYQNFESLKDSQKKAIQKWRLEKENQQKHEKRKEECKKERSETKPVRQRINIAQRIKEWKRKQLINKLKEEEMLKKEKEKLKAEEKRKKELQEIKKIAVEQFKKEKLKKLQETAAAENKELQGLKAQEAKIKNKILLNAFRLQDVKFMEKKKIIRLQIESKAKEKVEKLKLAKPALELILQRDPQRVLQPTLIWIQHCLEIQKREKQNPVFDLNSIPRLAIPEWRRELK